jgi:hypothetical protein
MTTLTPREGLTILAVNVPDDAHIQKRSFWINNVPALRYTEFSQPNGKYPVSKAISLPPGFKYSTLLDTKTATEEQWREVVEEVEVAGGNRGKHFGYVNYDDDREHDYNTSTESGLSLLRAHNLEGRYIILKQEKL